jgi:hypothetical protein
MTFTYNGIGTRYVGEQNAVDRSAECPWCKKTTRLRSYDTRMWFVVLFVPVIPLQKLRILDKCPRCSRHRLISHAKWVLLQDQARHKASDIVQERRDDPAGAIEAHRTLLGAHLTADARALAAAMQSRYADSPIVQVYLADIAALQNRPSDAQAGYARAHQLDPDNPLAREGLALSAVADGRLDEALDLLKPVIAGRRARGPSVCLGLARALARAQRHTEAHPILTAMLALFPALEGDKAFAKQMRVCEKKLGMPRTRLRVSVIAKRRWMIAASVVLLALAGVVVADRQAAAHVTLHVVDSAADPIRVEIDGAGTLDFRKPGRQTIELSEGRYTAHVTGAVQKDIPFEIQSSCWPCFFDSSVNVLDASGNTLLVKSFATYSPSPSQQTQAEKVIEAAPFERFLDVDYAFCEMPRTLSVSGSGVNGPPVLMKVGLQMLVAPPEHVAQALVATKNQAQAMELAQTFLARDPNSPGMLDAYVAAAIAGHYQGRAHAFLAKRLAARPCDVAAQRAWLAIYSRPEDEARITAQCAELAASEPDEGTWPLLEGLTSTSLSRRIELLTRAAADERVEPYALGPLAAAQASSGDWTAALANAQRAMQGEDADIDSRNLVGEALLALGRNDEFEQMLRDRVAEQPCDFDALYDLVQILASREGPASPSIANLQSQAAAHCPEGWGRARRSLEIANYAARGAFDEVAKHAQSSDDPGMYDVMLAALAEAGRVDDLRARLRHRKAPQCDPYTALGAALACREAKDEPQAHGWEKMATAALGKTGLAGQVAHVLRSDRTKSAKAALDLPLRPHDKAIVLALVSFGDPTTRVQLIEQALALRPPQRFPHVTLERLLADAKGH